ncbi:MAG: hypothetical protein MIO93_09260, partial [ANME-2 cluster archaeon]|nr:hypothetical protein [ANME-2 cluster archaeon]
MSGRGGRMYRGIAAADITAGEMICSVTERRWGSQTATVFIYFDRIDRIQWNVLSCKSCKSCLKITNSIYFNSHTHRRKQHPPNTRGCRPHTSHPTQAQ